MADHDHFDLVVIGSGPGGYVAAIRAAQLGLKVGCVEKHTALGGTCLNVGCIPSKALLDSSEHFAFARDHAAAHGIRTSVGLDLEVMMKRKDQVVRELTRGVEGLFRKNRVARFTGTGRIVAAGTVEVAGEKGTETLATVRILIATGSRPAVLPGIAFDGRRIVHSTGALTLPEVPRRLVVVGGSVGMAGAPALAARASLRAGVGLVTVAAPDAVRQIVHVLCPEATTSGPDIDPAGFDALAVGPGLGRSEEARGIFVRLAAAARPAVFDADALTLARLEIFAGRRAPTVLTPHPGEAGRLLGTDAASVNADRIGTGKSLASRSNAVVVLKGFRTVVAAPDGRVAVVLAGNPGMATGGAGDVLTGITGALLARGLSAWDAARTAAWLHGAAGDIAAEALGEESVVASDLADNLPGAFSLARDARPR